MPISGLVIILENIVDAPALVHHLQNEEPRLEFGELQANRLPCVLETMHAKESEAVHDWLLRQPGILGVDVAFVSFDESGPASLPKAQE